MDTLERIVKDVLVDTLCSKSAILETFPIEGAAADKLQTITSAASALGEETTGNTA